MKIKELIEELLKYPEDTPIGLNVNNNKCLLINNIIGLSDKEQNLKAILLLHVPHENDEDDTLDLTEALK